MCDHAPKFPTHALVPKRETNVTSFLNKFPEYDGRGSIIAIFDSGVDPGAKGLQKTSDGKPKIIEMVDASGAGDVDTTTVVEMVDNCITGLSGRKLKIPPHWKNPSGKFHIGIKSAYDIYCKQVRERVRKERKEKFWDPPHKLLLAESTRKLQEFQSKNPVTSALSQKEKWYKEDLEAQIEVLNGLDKKYTDFGPTYDCVVFHDGDKWRAVIDISESGELQNCRLLGNFSETYEYAMLTPSDRVNYCINVYDDGNLLEIVSQTTGHGTHVACIAAAYFENEPDKNGIAPGAQVVSVCIGDNRIGSMETMTSVTRAFIKAIKSKCDVINMSYGEHANWSGGRVLELFNEVVNKHGIVMVSSAGNHGPALSTMGTPPTMPSMCTLGVGAYVSPDMMVAEYSLREKMPGLGYTWTSRGPCINGALGVSFCAPGGAITSVPNWTLRGTSLMNGTSMSSPHAAGCICLLISGLKQENIEYSPYSIRRALENTSLQVSTWDALSMGHGLIQVDKAFDHLQKFSNCIENMVRFHVTSNGKNGLYLREPNKVTYPSAYNLTIEPFFLDDAGADSDKKINFNLNLKIFCDVPWVTTPADFCLMYTSRQFSVRIDPVGLPLGEHFAWVKAYDSSNILKGPVFHFPITVIKSRKIIDDGNGGMSFSVPNCLLPPGKINREFIEVPHGATFAILHVKSCDIKNGCCVVVHALQLRPQLSCKAQEYYKLLRLNPLEESTVMFKVKEKFVMELVLAQWWTSHETATLNYTITFHGLLPDSQSVVMHGADGIHRIELQSNITYEDLLPNASLKSHVMVLRPSEHKISPLKSRDVIPFGRQIYELQLNYAFNISRSTEITPIFSALCDILYESEYESQLWMLFDSNKLRVGSGDAYPTRYALKVEKGEYTLKLHVRQEDVGLLEKLIDAPILISVKLQSNIAMEIFDKHSNALVNGKKACSQTLAPGTSAPIFILPLSTDKLPKSCSSGNYLSGTITYWKDDGFRKADFYQFKYIIPEMPRKSSSTKQNSEKDKTLGDEYAEEMKQMQVSWIAKFIGDESKKLFEEFMEKEKESTWTILLARLQSVDKENEDKIKKVHLLQIISLTDKILAVVKPDEVLMTLASKTEKKELPNYKKLEQQKNCIIEALVKKGKAMCDLLALEKWQIIQGDENLENFKKEKMNLPISEDLSSIESTVPEELQDSEFSDIVVTMDKIDEVLLELQKWSDVAESKIASFAERQAIFHHHYGRALKLFWKQQDEKRVPDIERKCISLYEALGWDHCAKYFKRNFLARYPLSYTLF